MATGKTASPQASDLPETLREVSAAARATELPRARRDRRGQLFLGAYTVALVAFGLLVVIVYTHRTLTADVLITRAVQSYHVGPYEWLLTQTSVLGYSPANVISIALIVAALLALRLRMEAVLILACVLASGGMVTILKLLVHRPRPTRDLVHVAHTITGGSFPSGHVVTYTVLYGFLFYLLLTTWVPSPWRNLGLAICGALVLLVGPSRVFLGEHWPSDTLGAYLLGALWLGLAIRVHLALLARQPSRSPRHGFMPVWLRHHSL